MEPMGNDSWGLGASRGLGRSQGSVEGTRKTHANSGTHTESAQVAFGGAKLSGLDGVPSFPADAVCPDVGSWIEHFYFDASARA